MRIVLYWLMCLLAMTLLLLVWGMIAGPAKPLSDRLKELWSFFGPVAVVSLLLLPGVIFDLMRLSNHFVGPVFRLRRSMRDLAQGRPVAAVRFREGDFWQDFADDFNTVAARAGRAVGPPPAMDSVPAEDAVA